MKEVVCVLLLACAATLPRPVLSAPLANSNTQDQHTMLSVESSTGMSQTAAIASLRSALPPLQSALQSRQQRLHHISSVLLVPLVDKLQRANATAKQLKKEVDEAHTRLSELPTLIQQAIANNETLAQKHHTLKQDLDTTVATTEQQLADLMEQAQQARSDNAVLTELLKWIDVAALDWDGPTTFAQLRTMMSKLHTNNIDSEPSLLQLQHKEDHGQASTPVEMKQVVVLLRDKVAENADTLQRTYANLTATLGNEKTRFENEMLGNEKAQQILIVQVKGYHSEMQTLQEEVKAKQEQITQHAEQIDSLRAQLKQASKEWEEQQHKVEEIQEALEAVNNALRTI